MRTVSVAGYSVEGSTWDDHPVPARVVVVLVVFLALAACDLDPRSRPAPFELPVGSSEWNLSGPSSIQDDVLRVGNQSVRLGDGVSEYALSPTGAYWMNGQVLTFTSSTGDTQEVRNLEWSSLVVSPDLSTLALLDGSHGPVDEYGTHALQVVVFDTRTGEQLYRTPDEEPEAGNDLADLYEETSPYVDEVSNEHVALDGITIDIATGVVTVDDPESLGANLFADR